MTTHMVTDRQTLTVEEAAALLGIGRNTAYQAIVRGELPVIRIGRRLLISKAALEGLLAAGRFSPDGGHDSARGQP